jgi:hypothetical protein
LRIFSASRYVNAVPRKIRQDQLIEPPPWVNMAY